MRFNNTWWNFYFRLAFGNLEDDDVLAKKCTCILFFDSLAMSLLIVILRWPRVHMLVV